MDKEASYQDGLELRCPQRPIIRFSEVPSTHCVSESLGDICLLAHNELSSGQTSICHRSWETRGVRRIEGAAGHVEIASVSQERRRRCDSIELDSSSAVILSPKGFWDCRETLGSTVWHRVFRRWIITSCSRSVDRTNSASLWTRGTETEHPLYTLSSVSMAALHLELVQFTATLRLTSWPRVIGEKLHLILVKSHFNSNLIQLLYNTPLHFRKKYCTF